MNAMTQYKLQRVEKLSGEPVTLSSDPQGELIELKVGSGIKYALMIDVGDLPPKEAFAFVNKCKETLGDFFGKGNNVLLCPRRRDGSGTEIFELVVDEEVDDLQAY